MVLIRKIPIYSVRLLFIFAILITPASADVTVVNEPGLPADVLVCPSGVCFCLVTCKDGTTGGYARGERNAKCSVTEEDRGYGEVGCKEHRGVQKIACSRHLLPPAIPSNPNPVPTVVQ